MTAPLLAVENLSVAFRGVRVVQGVSFTVEAGETVALVGESGSGKSVTALSILRLLSATGSNPEGRITLDGTDVLAADAGALQRLRGGVAGMVFQEPMTSLNPLHSIGRQVSEAITLHRPLRGAALRDEVIRRLELAGLPNPAERINAYPHQLSGGQRQRVMLAIALANDPAVLICDEPTTALDVTVQAQMLDLILAGVAERDAALLFITHDLAVVAQVCERVLVVYGGRVVEAGPIWDVFTNPRHRYTRGLLDASDLAGAGAGGRLPTIRGAVPPAGQFPAGCVFRNRCDHADAACETLPAWRGTPRHGHACEHPVEPARA